MNASSTMLSLRLLRSEGYTAAVVERWLVGPGVRQDLFGFVDIVALRGDETLAVQTTTSGQVAAHLRKIADAPNLGAVREAGWRIEVHGWRQSRPGARYELHRRVDVS